MSAQLLMVLVFAGGLIGLVVLVLGCGYRMSNIMFLGAALLPVIKFHKKNFFLLFIL